MGKTHALSGAAAWLALAPVVDQVTALDGREIVAGTLITAGAALLPDLDHPSGTMARSWGPLTGAASWLTVLLFGPHRHGTHSLLFAGLAAVGGTLAGRAGGWWIAVPVFLAVTMAVGFWRKRGLLNEIVGAVIAAAMFTGDVGSDWLGVALGLGCLLHVAGDALTEKPQRLLFPAERMVDGAGVFDTNTRGERALFLLLIVATLVLANGLLTGDPYMHDTIREAVTVALDDTGAPA